MALIERKVVLHEKDASGNTVMNFPVTRASYVEDAVTSVNGSTGDVNIKDYVTSLSVSGKTVTYTKKDGTSGTITTQDTTYSLPTASSSTKGGVTIGDNITVSSGKISLTKSNVTTALGYTPLQTAPVTSVNGATGAVTIDAAPSSHTHDYLPLGGGTLTGAITTSTTTTIKSSSDTSYVRFLGGTSTSDGAQLELYSSNGSSNKGSFIVRTKNGDKSSALDCRADGTMLWGGKNVLTEANGLPLSGGTLTGKVTFSSDRVIDSTNASGLFIVADANTTSTKTGCISVFPVEHSQSNRNGGFQLVASDGTNNKTLTGHYTNGLKWNDKNVVTSVNNTSADADGNVTLELSSAYQIPYATCSTAKATKAKVATISNGVPFKLVTGAMVAVKFSNNFQGRNDGSISTLNVNSTGAKNVSMFSNGSGTYIVQGQETYVFVYNGSYWCAVSCVTS